MDPSGITQEQREEMFREFHGQQIRRQTWLLDRIHMYVAVWFWVTAVGVAVFVLIALVGA